MQSMENKHREYGAKDKVSGDKEERKEGRKGRKPGRKSSKIDMKAKLERSRQSARECRARKKIRYQYLDELVADREKAVLQLRKELEMYTQWARAGRRAHSRGGPQDGGGGKEEGEGETGRSGCQPAITVTHS